MQIIAAILALVAIFLFLLAAYGGAPDRSPRWHYGWLGLAVLTISWMVQIIVLTGSKMTID